MCGILGQLNSSDEVNVDAFSRMLDTLSFRGPDGSGEWLTSTSANSYKADFTMPAGKANGTYTVWAHNGLGQHYGWSEPQGS